MNCPECKQPMKAKTKGWFLCITKGCTNEMKVAKLTARARRTSDRAWATWGR